MTATLIPNADDLRIAEQLAMAKAMRERGMTDKGGSGMAGQVYMVGNQYGNLAQSLGGAILGAKAASDRDQLQATRDQQKQAWLAQMPSATETLDIQQATPEQQFGPTQAPTVPTEVQKSPRALERAMYAWGIQAPEGMEGVRNHVLTQAITAPQRQAELEQKSADRMHELQMKLLENRATQQERQEFQEKLLKMQLEGRKDITRLAAALRPPPAPHYPPTQMTDQGLLERQPDGSWKPVKVGDTVAGKPFAPPKPDAATNKAIHEGNIGIANIDRAIDLINERPQSLGTVYAIPGAEMAGQYLDPDGVSARAAVSNVGSLKLHDRSGAAVTVSEFPRLAPFIPSPKDKPEVAKKKLEGLRAEYQTIVNEWSSGANTSMLGGRPNNKTSNAPSSGGLTPAEQAELDALRAKHGRK